MKYFSLTQIQEALRVLKPHHAIFATTFFVMKRENAPIGEKMRFSLDAANHEFLERHYRVHPKSEYFFRVMRQNNPKKDWNEPVYAGKGLQSVNTRGLPQAFEHDTNENTWGWSTNYVHALSTKLPKKNKLSLFHVAVWLYKYRSWPDEITRKGVVQEVIKEYSLTSSELEVLFETEIISDVNETDAFQELPVKWHQILAGYSQPKDVAPEQSGILGYLETENVGPVRHLRFEPAKRLNIVTGDNGLGKTFLLDLAWWALTQDWADHRAWPFTMSKGHEPTIRFVVAGSTEDRPVKARWNTVDWKLEDPLPTISGLVIYARVDGSFGVWDPVTRDRAEVPSQSRVIKFSREEVWEGNNQIEGLIRDWVRWQERPDKYPFGTFRAVLQRLSPPDLGTLEAGEPVRLPGDLREMPTLVHPYGPVPIRFVSAGVKRIVTLAYLIVWAWEEHKIQARQLGKKEERQMVVIIDEAEAHLHPKWQRVILPALLEIGTHLNAELSLQLLVATHSPLVMASSEPIFDAEQDKLFHLDMSTGGKVKFREVPFEVRGTIDSWLASSLFDLEQPGSAEREFAIRDAVRLQEMLSPAKTDVEEVTGRLRDFLAPEDPFWVRWVFFAEKYGVHV